MFRNPITGLIIVIYIDNLLLIARLVLSIEEVVVVIREAFKIRLLGKLYYYLGIRVIRDRSKRQLIIIQDSYIDKIAAKFGLTSDNVGILLSKLIASRLTAVPKGFYTISKDKELYQSLVSLAV